MKDVNGKESLEEQILSDQAAGHGSNVPMQPSVPPMPSNTSEHPNSSDTISRADVEQTIEDNILCYTHSDRPIDHDPDTECHMAIRTALRMLRKDLRKLPPAGPQIIYCKDCKYRGYYRPSGYICVLDTGDPYMTGRNAEDDDWFCADAERKEATK